MLDGARGSGGGASEGGGPDYDDSYSGGGYNDAPLGAVRRRQW